MPKPEVKDGDLILGVDIGFKHLGICQLKTVLKADVPFVVQNWQVVDLGTTRIDDACVKLIELIRENAHWAASRYVIIEHQSAKFTVKNVALSHAMQVALIMAAPNGSTPPTVFFAASASKFHQLVKVGYALKHPKHTDKGLSDSVRKRMRKENAVDLCFQILKQLEDKKHDKLLENTNLDQRDDLGDAMVYAAGFVFKHLPKKPKKKQPVSKRKTMKIEQFLESKTDS
jgi:hypothetical protein